MTNTPSLNRILFGFYVLVTLVVGVAALIWPTFRSIAYAPVRDILFPNVFLPSQASMPITLSVAVPPTLESWVKANAAEFTKQNPFIQVEVTQLRGLDAGQRLNTLTGQADVWIAEADFARSAAGSIPYENQGRPVALDTFLWVAVKSHTELSGNLNWTAIAKSAGSNPQFKVTMPPANTVEGMAACWAAAAEYHGTDNVTATQINDPAFRRWLSALFQAAPDRNRSPRDQLSTRPPQADVGLILSSDWSQLAQGSFISQSPVYNVAFNYPYYVRSNWQNLQVDEAKAHQEAAVKFRDFLLGNGPQSKLSDYGFGRAGTQLAGQLLPTDESIIRALQFCWQ
jgi:ABC-type Fe3+ transport system substrate-binding protein